MPEEEMQAGVSARVVKTTEQPFKPEKAVSIKAILEPEEEEDYTFYTPEYYDFYDTLLPPAIPEYAGLPTYSAEKRELILNIETTATLPWESRILAIGVMDPNDEVPQAINFIQATEEETLDQFIEFFEASPYTELIGYNVSFDYRFLYAAMQKYRKTAPKYMAARLYDLMQQQEQVKQAFVYGYNKPGKLDQWAEYLFGIKPPAEQKDIYKWYKEGNVEAIADFNTYKLTMCYYLWVLNKVVEGTIPTIAVIARPGAIEGTEKPASTIGSLAEFEDSVEITCPTCGQKQYMPRASSVVSCNVCNTPISNPGL